MLNPAPRKVVCLADYILDPQMADQMSMPMTVNEISVHGAKNIRRGFLDPIFSPLLSGSPNAPQTVGDVMGKLQIASGKLSGLRM